jgi:hypothetical protein
MMQFQRSRLAGVRAGAVFEATCRRYHPHMSFRLHACASYLGLATIIGMAGCGGEDPNATGNFSTGMVDTSTDTGTTVEGDGDGDSGDGDSGDGDGDTGDGDGDSGDGDGDSGDGDGDSGDGDGDGDSGDGDGDGDTGDGDGDTGDGDGDGDPDLCPPAPGDDACTLCVKGACCIEVTACDADPDCICMRDCIDEGGSNNQCKNMCDIQGSNENYQAFNGCVDDFCQAECE